MNNKILHIAEILFHTHGINIVVYDDNFISKSLDKRLILLGNSTFENYCQLLQNSETEALEFINSLNISYSEFFRNPLTYACLAQLVLPALIEKKKKEKQKEIRIWSAACASGQEAYSIAMLCHEMAGNDKFKPQFRIFATDFNSGELEKARKGIYPLSAMDNVTIKRQQYFFSQKGNYYSVVPELKELIDFSVFDLLSDQNSCPPSSIFGNFDLVFCSNLLFYYKPNYRQIIISKATNCLASGGYLVTGEVEREIIAGKNFSEIFLQSAIFKRLT
jgi:chemotaxis protein methyltransferase CheR